MTLKSLLVAGLTAGTALALPNSPSSGRPGSKLERTIDSTDVSYRIERRAFERGPPDGEPASRPEGDLGPEGNLMHGGSGLTPEMIEQIRFGETVPGYGYGDAAELPKEAKPGDGKSGVYDTRIARQKWINGVKIRVVPQAEAILAKVSGGLYNPGLDLSALSKKDAALIRSLIKNLGVNGRDLKGFVPFQYIDAKFWSWRAADSYQPYTRGEFQTDVYGKIVTEGEIQGQYVDKDGVFTRGDLKGWELGANGHVAEGRYKGKTLNRHALVVGEPLKGSLKGWRLKPDGTILKPLNDQDPDFSGSIISPTGRMETGPARGYKLSPGGMVLDGDYERQSMDSKGFFTTGKVEGFKLEPKSGIIVSPDNFKGLRLNNHGELLYDSKEDAWLDGFKVKSDGSILSNYHDRYTFALKAIPLVRDGNTLAFTGTLDGFKLTDPKTIIQSLPLHESDESYKWTDLKTVKKISTA